jgi:NAD(P)-dependent dehydrogenase (short-subunit alcohol dehydrogenase family)
MKQDTGGPAFPRAGKEWGNQAWTEAMAEDGMSLRDYFAAKAMQAAFAEMLREKPCEGAAAAIRVSAVIAYQMADAMLEARGK